MRQSLQDAVECLVALSHQITLSAQLKISRNTRSVLQVSRNETLTRHYCILFPLVFAIRPLNSFARLVNLDLSPLFQQTCRWLVSHFWNDCHPVLRTSQSLASCEIETPRMAGRDRIGVYSGLPEPVSWFLKYETISSARGR